MNKKKLILTAFILVALAQLYVPAKMIFDKEDILAKGKEYKFKTAPIDPNDPFRGKYIALRYEENTFKVQNEGEWMSNETIYVILATDKDGFAKIHSVSKVKPQGNRDFVKAKVRYFTNSYDKEINIEYPFNRFYMEEYKAPVAEKAYREALSDSAKVTYALIRIKDGDAVIKDVLIDGISINEIVKNKKNNKK
ncbi:MAG: GDYXXLXY domain-containing protein [Bacteroidales bacterium]|nr:GDYXXLXY domain-containing protein [Bacteroidales bacterium]